jgi:hypothetical protein
MPGGVCERVSRTTPGYAENLRHYRGDVTFSRPTSILSHYDDEDLGGDAPGDWATNCSE